MWRDARHLLAHKGPEVPAGLSAVGVGRLLLQHPWRYVGRRWNYKSAIMSGCVRGGLFFVVNVTGGMEAALGALSAEFCLRFLTAGYYGALTQAFRRVEPEPQAVISALIFVPALGHVLELIVHSARGTPNLEVSIGTSMAFTLLSTSFNLFAMRRGAFATGPGSQSLLNDLLRLPTLLVSFVGSIVRGVVRV